MAVVKLNQFVKIVTRHNFQEIIYKYKFTFGDLISETLCTLQDYTQRIVLQSGNVLNLKSKDKFQFYCLVYALDLENWALLSKGLIVKVNRRTTNCGLP